MPTHQQTPDPTAEDLSIRFAEFRRRTEMQPDAVDGLDLLSRDCIRLGNLPMAIDCLSLLGEALANAGQVSRALISIDRAFKLSLDADRPDLTARCMLLRAITYQASSAYGLAIDEILELVRSPAYSAMEHRLRSRAMLTLADLCVICDPGDAVDLCLSFALPRDPDSRKRDSQTLTIVASIRLDRCLWSHPLFGSLTRYRPLEDLALPALIADCRSLVEEAAAAWKPSDGELPLAITAVLSEILEGLASRKPGHAERAWKELLRVGASNRRFVVDTAYPMAALAMIEGDTGLAEVIAHFVGDDPGASPPDRWEIWLHMRYLIDRARGKFESALGYFERYAQLSRSLSDSVRDGVRDAVALLSSERIRTDESALPFRPRYFAKAIELIEGPGGVSLGVAQLARMVGVSERTLRQSFRDYTGKSVKQYTTDVRLDLAHQHAMTTGRSRGSLEELARVAGFTNASRFGALYRKRFGDGMRKGSAPPGPRQPKRSGSTLTGDT